MILSSETYETFFTSYNLSFEKEPNLNIKHYVECGKLLHPTKYQVVIKIKYNLIFSVIHFNLDKSHLKKVDKGILKDVLNKILELISKEDVDNLIKWDINTYHQLEQRIGDILFPECNSIMFLGNKLSGKSSISRLFFSYSRVSAPLEQHIPYHYNYNGIKIKLMDPSSYEGWRFGVQHFKPDRNSKYDNFFLVLDSTNINFESIKRAYLASLDDKILKNKNILIIANKQDLPNAMEPEKIEKELGFPTVGFSAIAPDAPIRLEEIINNFLNETSE